VSLVLFCPWCGEKTPAARTGPLWCKKCLHRVDVIKSKCDCLQCAPFPTALPEVPAREEAETEAPPSVFQFLNPNDPIDHFNAEDATSGLCQVVGRYFLKPHLTATVYPSRVIIAVGDKKEPDQWVHVIIDAELLGKWVHAMGLADDDNGDGIE
jgi:hypothetical protein